MPTTPERHPTAHVTHARAHIGNAAASTSGLLDLLTAGLAEDDRQIASEGSAEAEHGVSEHDDESGDRHGRDHGGTR